MMMMMATMAPPDRLLAVSAEGFLPSAEQWAAIEACPRIVSRLPEESYASGVVVGFREESAYILSAQHAASGSRRQFHFFNAESMPQPVLEIKAAGTAVMFDKTADVVLYKVPWPVDVSWKPTPILLAQPGDRPKRFPFDGMSIGCSEGRLPTANNETILAKRMGTKSVSDVAFFWEAKTPPKPGRSGGPLLNKDGKLIGLCAASKENAGYYAHLDEIQSALLISGYDWLWKKQAK
jgi:hypothetical protein